ncbi:hypothetical protein KEM48_010448 [Puccinia striiformis f. sp. tritici PST-130]|nr:hypothetical protein KEM48_010448 [Puccinia striiformis f. sp. tritici PST-130]
MAVIFLSAFFRAILGLTPTDWSDGAALCPKMTYLWLMYLLIVIGFSIAVTLLTHLRKLYRHHHFTPAACQPRIAPQSSQQRLGTSTTASPTSQPTFNYHLNILFTHRHMMFSLLCLVLAMHGTEFDPQLPKATGIFTALRLLATPTYAVTFLYTLNRRNRRDAVYHNSILTGRMPALTPRVSHNTNFGFQPPGLQVDLPATEVKHNWTQMLGTASTRSTRTRIGKDSMTKLYFPEAFKNFSSVSFRKSTNQTKPRFPEPPPPVHVNEPQPGLMRQTESPVQNFDSLDHGHISGHRRSLSQHSSVIQIHHGTAI